MSINFFAFMGSVAENLQTSGNYGTAHVYRSSMNALIAFNNGEDLVFREFTPEFLKRFEIHLRSKGCSWNTASTYLRTLRAVHNRAVDQRKAEYVPHLFKHVYTGTKADKKRALDKEEMQLLTKKIRKTGSFACDMERTRAYFALMFFLRGIPFVDLAYLRKSDLKGNAITYRRRKTGRQLSVTLLPEAMEIVKKFMNTNPASPYLFPFLQSEEGSKEAYKEYQIALRHFNHQLGVLQEFLGLSAKLSSYSPRHTWATTAYHCEVHPGIISEAMGHSSIIVTETYLKPFKNKRIEDANATVVSYIRN